MFCSSFFGQPFRLFRIQQLLLYSGALIYFNYQMGNNSVSKRNTSERESLTICLLNLKRIHYYTTSALTYIWYVERIGGSAIFGCLVEYTFNTYI